MKVKMCLEKLELVIRQLNEQSEVERVQSYAAIITLIKLIDRNVYSGKYQQEVFDEYKGHLLEASQVLCGLMPAENGRAEASYFDEAIHAVQEVRSRYCSDCN